MYVHRVISHHYHAVSSINIIFFTMYCSFKTARTMVNSPCKVFFQVSQAGLSLCKCTQVSHRCFIISSNAFLNLGLFQGQVVAQFFSSKIQLSIFLISKWWQSQLPESDPELQQFMNSSLSIFIDSMIQTPDVEQDVLVIRDGNMIKVKTMSWIW